MLRRQASNDRARKANKLLFNKKGEGSISVSGFKLEQRFDKSNGTKFGKKSYKEAGKSVDFSRMSLKNFAHDLAKIDTTLMSQGTPFSSLRYND